MPDGTVKWVQNNVYPMVEDGIIVKLKGVIIDVTERKESEIEKTISVELLKMVNSQKNLHELMKGAASVLKEWSGCEAVGIRLKEGSDYPYFETDGFTDEFVKKENKLCA